MRTLSPSTLLVLALAGTAAADPPAGVTTFRGRLDDGASMTHNVPDQSRGFWMAVLDGDTEGTDIDLRLRAGEQHWASRGEEAHEELLIPCVRGLVATVEHYSGNPSGYTLTLTHIQPARKVQAGRTCEGNVDSDAVAYQIHELPATGTRFNKIVLDSTSSGVDLDLYLYSDGFEELGSSLGQTARETIVISPSRERRWLVVKAYSGSAPYTLALEPIGADAPRLDPDEGSQRGTLAAGGECLFRLRTTREGIVTVRLEGPAQGVDIDLAIFGPDGYYRQSIAADAAEEIAINGARRGEYLIRVYPGGEGAQGAFTLSTERLDIQRMATTGRGGSHTWGLFVGVADYQNINDLQFTRGDALSLYQGLRQQGDVDTRHSIVLLDEMATRAQIGQALDTIAARADEDDVFVFFYSGHGGNEGPDGEGNAADERDHGDEYICCYDSGPGTSGDLTDDELHGYMDRIAARTQILLFDACFAGGFGEVIDRDGRYGCFSSLETQTSNEARNLKAGLLTAVLNRALTGEADASRDGKVSLSELSAFVNRVQPQTCPSCSGSLSPSSNVCRDCGARLDGDNERQIPVIVDRTGGDVILTQPGRANRRTR